MFYHLQIKQKSLILSETFLTFATRTFIIYKNMKGFGFFAAFLGGAVAGAVAGLLLAPEKGADTRVKVGNAVDEFMKKHNIKLTRKEMEDLVDDVNDAFDDDL